MIDENVLSMLHNNNKNISSLAKRVKGNTVGTLGRTSNVLYSCFCVDFTRIDSCHYQSIMFSQDLYQNEQAAYTGHVIRNLCDIRDNPSVKGLQPVEAQD